MTIGATIDWVEGITGISGPSQCERTGHEYERDLTRAKVVHGRLACPVQCRVCGRRGYHWLPDEERPQSAS